MEDAPMKKHVRIIALGLALLGVAATGAVVQAREAERSDDRGKEHTTVVAPRPQLAREAERGDDRGKGGETEPADDRGRGA